MLTDTELLRSYARNGSESAFTELVRQHIDIVYSAALRETRGDVSQAQDITQAVFVELARKASSLSRHPALAGWLYTCVRHVAANMRRADARRLRREQEAQSMHELCSPDSSDSDWRQVQPVLDDAMHELSEKDRAVVVLRFFEDRSLKEVGLAIGLNENAARMRVDRSLEKLRRLLVNRGITSTGSSLVAMLAAGAVTSAPTSLAAATVATSALATAASTTSATFTLLNLMTMKLKVTAVSAAVLAAVAVPVWQEVRFRQLTDDNEQLRAQSMELPALRQELEDLRPLQIDRSELERLRGMEAELQSEVARLRNRVGSAQRSEAEIAHVRNELARRQQEDPLNAVMSKAMASGLATAKNWREQDAIARAARMKEKLNLSGEQEQAVREILLHHVEIESQVGEKTILGRMTAEERVEMFRSAGNAEEQIQALLSSEQRAAYPNYVNEERMDNAHDYASSETARMQNPPINLSPEQQDAVYSRLYEARLNGRSEPSGTQADSFPDPGDLSAIMKRQVEQQEQQLEEQLKALQGVLSPEQLQSYRQLKAGHIKMQRDMTEALLPP